ncbi:MAG: hypothetical protein U9N14_02400 [Pseudomonadota bacterium]|nr:hypothetical protein [Pseudomonadota bacterium]
MDDLIAFAKERGARIRNNVQKAQSRLDKIGLLPPKRTLEQELCLRRKAAKKQKRALTSKYNDYDRKIPALQTQVTSLQQQINSVDAEIGKLDKKLRHTKSGSDRHEELKATHAQQLECIIVLRNRQNLCNNQMGLMKCRLDQACASTQNAYRQANVPDDVVRSDLNKIEHKRIRAIETRTEIDRAMQRFGKWEKIRDIGLALKRAGIDWMPVNDVNKGPEHILAQLSDAKRFAREQIESNATTGKKLATSIKISCDQLKKEDNPAISASIKNDMQHMCNVARKVRSSQTIKKNSPDDWEQVVEISKQPERSCTQRKNYSMFLL